MPRAAKMALRHSASCSRMELSVSIRRRPHRSAALRIRELLGEVTYDGGRTEVRMEEEEEQLDEDFSQSFEELLAEMKQEK